MPLGEEWFFSLVVSCTIMLVITWKFYLVFLNHQFINVHIREWEIANGAVTHYAYGYGALQPYNERCKIPFSLEKLQMGQKMDYKLGNGGPLKRQLL